MKRIRLNETERVIYDALVAISRTVMTLEDATEAIKKISRPELDRVLAVFNNKIEEYEYQDLVQSAYDAQGYADTVLYAINELLNPEEGENI